MPSTYELAEAHRLPQPLLFFFSEASYPSGSEILAFLREDEPGCVVASTLGRTLLKWACWENQFPDVCSMS